MIPEDLRAQVIQHWLVHDLSLDFEHLTSASSDASFRRYFRIATPNQSYIVMDAPPERENIQPFIKVAGIMREAGVNVPEIHAYDVTQGIMLLEDFGSISLLQQLDSHNADSLYQDAWKHLLNLQMHSHSQLDELDLPEYDAAFFERELTIFYEWFLGNYLGIAIPEAVKNQLNKLLIDSALEQPKTCVHRDFHSRNLMVLTENNPGVIDFQDAVIGPISYDLVSLLKDCYINWPTEQVDRWREQYLQRLQQLNLVQCDSATFKRWFDWMGLQRHLKAIGIFSRLYLRDGKSGYLQDIPRTLRYVADVTEGYPELADFKNYLTLHVLPIYRNKIL